MTRRRKLRPEELELWQTVARTAEPMARPFSTPQVQPEPRSFPDPSPPAEDTAQPALPRFALGQSAPPHPERHATTTRQRDRLKAAPLQMDARVHNRMKGGKLRPEGRIDLHGMTQAEAHPLLIGFVLKSQAAGKRLVLVITGKGSPDEAPWPIPRRRGVLRLLVPDWLAQGPAATAVQQIVPAHIRHGGEGAYYVYLRKRR